MRYWGHPSPINPAATVTTSSAPTPMAGRPPRIPLFVPQGGHGVKAACPDGREEPAQSAEQSRQRQRPEDEPPREAKDGEIERDALARGDVVDDHVADHGDKRRHQQTHSPANEADHARL